MIYTLILFFVFTTGFLIGSDSYQIPVQYIIPPELMSIVTVIAAEIHQLIHYGAHTGFKVSFSADQMDTALVFPAVTAAHGLNDYYLASLIQISHFLHLIKKTRYPVIYIHKSSVQHMDYLAMKSPDKIRFFPQLSE